MKESGNFGGIEDLEVIFPELESEDEKIRKSVSAYFTKFNPNDMWDADFSFADIVAWLEKQGKQRSTDKNEPTDYNSIDPCFGKPIDKIEQPKLTAFEEAIKGMMAEYRYAIGNTDAITEEEVKNNSEYLLSLIPQKPIEWSKEDLNMFCSIRSILSMYMDNFSVPKEIRDIHKKELKWFDELYNRGLS